MGLGWYRWMQKSADRAMAAEGAESPERTGNCVKENGAAKEGADAGSGRLGKGGFLHGGEPFQFGTNGIDPARKGHTGAPHNGGGQERSCASVAVIINALAKAGNQPAGSRLAFFAGGGHCPRIGRRGRCHRPSATKPASARKCLCRAIERRSSHAGRRGWLRQQAVDQAKRCAPRIAIEADSHVKLL